MIILHNKIPIFKTLAIQQPRKMSISWAMKRSILNHPSSRYDAPWVSSAAMLLWSPFGTCWSNFSIMGLTLESLQLQSYSSCLRVVIQVGGEHTRHSDLGGKCRIEHFSRDTFDFERKGRGSGTNWSLALIWAPLLNGQAKCCNPLNKFQSHNVIEPCETCEEQKHVRHCFADR